MFNRKSVEIAILGAGPVGLTAAHILHDRDVDFVIMDREPQSHSHSYALALHPDTLELLDALGVIGPVLQHATRLQRAAIFDSYNHQRAVMDFSELPVKYPFLAVIGQDVLESVLTASLAAKGRKVLWNHRVRCIENKEDQVNFIADRLIEGMTGYAVAHMEPEIDKIFEYSANYMIAADGYDSCARKAAKIEFPEIASNLNYAVFEFNTNTKPMTEMRLMVEGNLTHIFWPLGDGRCRFSFQISSRPVQRASYSKDNPMIEAVAKHIPELSDAHLDELLARHAPWFIGSSSDVEWRTLVHFEKHLVDSFGRGRIWLAGDAAHLAPPAGVLSMNVGMVEVADLADKLSSGADDKERQKRLEAYNLDRVLEWRRLLDVDHKIKRRDAEADWLMSHRESIIGNIPAFGQTFDQVLEQLHLVESVA